MTIGRRQFDTESAAGIAGEQAVGVPVAIVTGGAGGIGAATCRQLADDGFAVVIVYHASQVQAQRLERDIAESGGTAWAVGGDVSSSDDVEMIVDAVADRFGRIDALVNNAGISSYLEFGSMSGADIDREFAVNVRSVVLMTQACVPHMRNGGSIVNVSSNLAWAPLPGLSLYSATKAAVASLTKGFARELGGRGIRVNAVAPGATRTAMTEWIDDQTMAGIAAGTPLGRVGQPQDIASAIAMLASAQSGWISGQTIIVDGGLS